MNQNALDPLKKYFAACVLTCFAAAAAAAESGTSSYAIVSVIGDELSIVTYQPQTGSNLDTNLKNVLPLQDASFDRLAALAAANAIKRAVPDAQTQSMTAPDKAEFGADDELLHSAGRLKSFLAPIKAQLAQPDIRYLVLISKFRSDAHLNFAQGGLGTGKLAGLGFYLDYFLRTRAGTGEMGKGFIAPYAYLTVSLVDMSTGELVRSESVTESAAISAARSSTGRDPWTALSADRKVRLINGLINKAMQDVVPRVVAPG